MLSYHFRLPPGPNVTDLARLAEDLGYAGVWCPEVPAFGHDIYIALARMAEATTRIGVGAAVVIPSYRHALAQASAIATVEHLAPGRVSIGFGTGFTGRAGMNLPPLRWSEMQNHFEEVRGLLRGDAVDLMSGGVAQLVAEEGWLPIRPTHTRLLIAAQGPKGRAVAHEIADGLISLGAPAPGFDTCLVGVNGTVLEAGETIESDRVREVLAPLAAVVYHSTYARDRDAVKDLPNGEAWLASVDAVPEHVRHLSVHRGHNKEVSNGHDELIDVALAMRTTFTGTRDELRTRLADLEAGGATGIIFGTSGADVEREMRAYAEVAGL